MLNTEDISLLSDMVKTKLERLIIKRHNQSEEKSAIDSEYHELDNLYTLLSKLILMHTGTRREFQIDPNQPDLAVWKFDLENEISMPKGALILSVQLQRGNPQVWALVNKNNPKETRYFLDIGTGHPIKNDQKKLKFLGTYQRGDGNVVRHVFERESA